MLCRLLIVFLLLSNVYGRLHAEIKSYEVNISNTTAEWVHYWERCVGSGHAALSLRADYQSQLTQTTLDLGFKQVRFHGLFVDDMSVVLPGDG